MSEIPTAAYPAGFRPRRGLNWFLIGLLYASYYMCRYNFRFATPGMVAEFGFSTFQITGMLSAWSIAYGTGQLVNGLLTDRIGGKTAMLIGAAGTIVINLIFGFASFAGTFTTFAAIWLMNGYMQSFGAPGMVKMNAAWFGRTERGTFAGIFGFMIQLGQVAINNLAPVILAGFTVGTWVVARNDWHWLFRIPPLVVAIVAILLAIFVKETPEEAGYQGVIEPESANAGSRASLRESFTTICRHPLIWFYAVAYACTGAVRNSSDQLMILYFHQQLKLDLAAKPAAVLWTVNLMPLVAVLGSLSAGVISDRVLQRPPFACRDDSLLHRVRGHRDGGDRYRRRRRGPDADRNFHRLPLSRSRRAHGQLDARHRRDCRSDGHWRPENGRLRLRCGGFLPVLRHRHRSAADRLVDRSLRLGRLVSGHGGLWGDWGFRHAHGDA